jgi:hypothetical protein
MVKSSRADGSFGGGLLVGKSLYHTSLYDQHLRLNDCATDARLILQLTSGKRFSTTFDK